MKTYKRSEIRANRQKWIDHLKRPETKKHTGALESFEYPDRRCCLGHAAFVLGAERKVRNSIVFYGGDSGLLSKVLQSKLGMYTIDGTCEPKTSLFTQSSSSNTSLAGINDHTIATPQEIREYLESVIEGGPNTPFEPLLEYEE